MYQYKDDKLYRRSGVMFIDAFERKYLTAVAKWVWYWVFPSRHETIDPGSDIVRCHHLYGQTKRYAVKRSI